MSSTVGMNIWFAGAFAGVSINLLVFPLDTLKTRLQSPSFRQTYQSATGIVDRALWRGLYQGVGTVTLVAIPSSGVFFTTYEGLKYLLGGSSSSSNAVWVTLPPPAVHALSSSIAQLINCAVITPAEVLKQNAQMLKMHSPARGSTPRAWKVSSSPTIGILQQVKRHPMTLWRGYTALAARDLPFTALQFPAFEYLKEVLIARRSRLSKGDGPVKGVFERAWISALSAGIAGSLAAWVTTPFDVVKTRMMLQAGAEDTLEAGRVSGKILVNEDGRQRWRGRRRSAFQIGKEVFLNEGIVGLFRGGLIRTTFTFLGNGLYIGFYEGAKFYLQDSKKATRGKDF